MPQQQAKPKGMPPMKKPPGTGTAPKPKVLTAPSLAKPIGSQETDMSKGTKTPRAKMVHEMNYIRSVPSEKIPPGTIKKAMSFVTKGMGG